MSYAARCQPDVVAGGFHNEDLVMFVKVERKEILFDCLLRGRLMSDALLRFLLIETGIVVIGKPPM